MTPRPSFLFDDAAEIDVCSCWDGKNLDSPDHKSHVAYPVAGAQTFTGSSVGGACPSTHPVKIPQIMLEVRLSFVVHVSVASHPVVHLIPLILASATRPFAFPPGFHILSPSPPVPITTTPASPQHSKNILTQDTLRGQIVWDTTAFNNKAEWPADGSQPFVLSTGDTTGYGQHGDYVFGWKGDSLQRAMDGGCLGASCTGLKTQSNAEAAKCSVPGRVREDFDGCKSRPLFFFVGRVRGVGDG